MAKTRKRTAGNRESRSFEDIVAVCGDELVTVDCGDELIPVDCGDKLISVGCCDDVDGVTGSTDTARASVRIQRSSLRKGFHAVES